MVRHLPLALFILAIASPGAGQVAPHASGGTPPALLVIDIQNFYFEKGSLPLTGSEAAAAQARRVLDAFRAGKLPVIHIRHAPKAAKLVEGGPADVQYRIRDVVAPAAGEKVFTKHYANSFRETGLLEHLRQLKVSSLIIVGMQTHMCVEAAARAATDYGFDVTVIPEGCATRPLSHGGVTVPAEMVHAATLAAINGTYGRVVGIESWLAAR